MIEKLIYEPKNHVDCWRNLHDMNFRKCYSKTHSHDNIFWKLNKIHEVKIVYFYFSKGIIYDEV